MQICRSRGHPLATPVNRDERIPATIPPFLQLLTLRARRLCALGSRLQVAPWRTSHPSGSRRSPYRWRCPWRRSPPQKTLCSPACPLQAIRRTDRTDLWLRAWRSNPTLDGSRCGRNVVLPGRGRWRRAIRSAGCANPVAALPPPPHNRYRFPKARATSKGWPSRITW